MTRASALLMAVLAACGGRVPEDGERAPNIVLIVVDDLGYSDLSSYGSGEIPTPNIDSLAAEGVRFAHAYATSSVCSPSRAALLTGRYQQRFGHENNTGDIARQRELSIGLPVEERTLADLLSDAGYTTAAIGKWHLGVAPQFHPLRRGFDSFFGHLGGGHPYFRWDDPETGPIYRDEQPAEGSEYLTRAFSAEAVEFVREAREQPFFLYLAYNAPHLPLEAPDDLLARFAYIEDEPRRVYAAMVSAIDEGVGELLAALDELELTDDTLVVFVNDNGGAEVEPADNGVLRGYKRTPYEGGLRVPMIARWPGRLPSGEDSAALVSTLDIVPTALAAAGAPTPVERPLDGIDLIQTIGGGPNGRRSLFWRRGDVHAIRAAGWKLVQPRRGKPELYDLAADPGESRDLAASETARVAELEALYADWAAEMVEPLWEWRND